MQNEEDLFKQFYAQGGSLSLLLDMPKEKLDKIYLYANQLFQKKSFHIAKKFYFLLTQLDQWGFDYWLALGLCHQRLNEHEQAVSCFLQAGLILLSDPRPSCYAGISYECLGNTDYAHQAFRAAMQLSTAQPQYQTLHNIAAQALTRLPVKE